MTKKRTGRELENRLHAIGDMTDSKRAERALRGLEEQWRSLVENIPDTIMTVDADGTILFINRTVPGLTVEGVIGTSVYDYVPPEHHDTLRRRLERVFETGEAHGYKIAGAGPFGRPSWYFSRIGPIVRDGRVVAAVLITTDITEQRRAEEALRESEERYRDLVENINEVIYELDAGGRVTYISPVVQEVGGYSPSEIVGRPFAEFVHSDDLSGAVEGFQRSVSGHPRPNEYRLLSRSGEVYWVRSFGRPIREGDRVVGVRGVLTNITERKRAEEALQESEEQYRRLVQDSIDGIVIAEGPEIRFVNSALLDMIGCQSEEEIVGRPFTDFVSPEYREALLERNRDREQGQVVLARYEFKALRKDGSTFDAEASIGRVGHQGRAVTQAVVRDITERKRAEEALRESEERYRTLVETARDVIYTVSTDGAFTSLNSAFESMSGWSRAEWLGKPFAGMLHPDDLPLGTENFRRILQGEVPPVSEIRMLVKSGEYRTGEFSARPLIVGGEVVGSFGIVRDITERKRAEEALRESEGRFRSAFEDAAIGMALVAPDGRILHVNQVCCEVLGYSEQELTSMTWHAVSHPDDVNLIRYHIRRILAGEMHSYQLEKRYVHKDGHILWGHMTSSLLRDADGRPLYFISQIQDITDRKRTEEALRESEERYRLVTEAVPVLISYVDSQQRYRFANKTYEQWFGHCRSEVYGRYVKDVLGDAAYQAIRGRIESALSGQEVAFEDLVPYRDGGARHVSAIYIPDVNEQGEVRGFVALVSDITDHKRTEESLQASEHRYRELVELSPDAMVVHSEEKILFVNSAGVQLIGAAAPHQIIGRPIWDFVHPDHLKAARKRIQRARPAGKKVDVVEEKLVRLDGRVVDVEMAAIPVAYDGSAARQVIIRDISERKRMEEALQNARDEIESRVERQMQQGSAYGLTFRELTVLHLVADGRSDREIGAVLGISTLTAQKHVENIRAKMKASCRTEAGVRAIREGLLD